MMISGQEEQRFVFARLTGGKISSLGAEATNLLREDFQGMPMEGVHPQERKCLSQFFGATLPSKDALLM